MARSKFLTVICVISIYFLSMSFQLYLAHITELEKISTGYRSDEIVTIKTTAFLGKNRIENLRYLFEEKEIKEYLLFDDSLGNSRIRGVLVKGNLPHPKILKGRFFEESDYFKGHKVIVVGKEVLKYTHQNNGKTYFNLFNTEYEVIGVCGYGNQSAVDYIVYYNLDSMETSKEWGIYSIDTIKDKDRVNFLRTVTRLSETNFIKNENSGIKRLLGYENYNKIVPATMMILILSLVIVHNKLFFSVIKTHLEVFNLIGFSFWQSLKLTFVKRLAYESFGLIGSSLAYYVYTYYYCKNIEIFNSVAILFWTTMIIMCCSFILYFAWMWHWYRKKGIVSC